MTGRCQSSPRVLGDRQPEGRRRQDDDGHQSRHGAGRHRRARAGHRPRPAGQRLDRARRRRPRRGHARPTTCWSAMRPCSTLRLPTPVPGLHVVPANADLVGLEAELLGDDTRPFSCATRSRRCRRAAHPAGRHGVRLRADRLPAVAQPADAQRHGRGARRAGAGAVRVLRAGRHLAAQGNDRADPRHAQSGARDPGRRADDARCAHLAVARGRRRRARHSSGRRSTRR